MPKRSAHMVMQRSMRWLVLVIVAPLILACGQTVQPPPISVVATIAPLADWARHVGRDRVQVTQIVPAGVDPETYELTDADREALAGARVVLSNGLGLEPWLNDELAARNAQSWTGLQLSDYIGPLVSGKNVTSRSPLAGEADQDRLPLSTPSRTVYVPDTVYSPYIWLSPGSTTAQRAVLLIGDTLTRVDSQNIRFYRGNAERYIGELENLDGWVRRQMAEWPVPSSATATRPVIQLVDRSWLYFFTSTPSYPVTLRTFANGRPTAAPSEQATPLFVNRYTASAASGLPRAPDGVLDPLLSDNYTETIRRNVELMTQRVVQAAADGATLSSNTSERAAP